MTSRRASRFFQITRWFSAYRRFSLIGSRGTLARLVGAMRHAVFVSLLHLSTVLLFAAALFGIVLHAAATPPSLVVPQRLAANP